MRSKKVRPLGIRLWDFIYHSNIPFRQVSPITKYPVEPWLLTEPTIIFDLAEFPKETTPDYVYKDTFHQIKNKYHDHTFIYTDGSKMGSKTSSAAILPYDMFIQERLLNNSSIYSGEAVSIIRSLEWMRPSWLKKFFICSDSLSLLQGILEIESDNEYIKEIQLLLYDLKLQDKNIVFCWVPGHIGISGNEKADKKAKTALHLTQSNRKIPFQDCIAIIKPLITSLWQQSWDNQINNKLHEIKPKLGITKSATRKSRKEETVLARLRLGHTRLTHSYLMNGSFAPRCKFCRNELSIKHLIIRCRSIVHIRQKYFINRNMFEVFEKNEPINILIFFREIGYYNNI